VTGVQLLDASTVQISIHSTAIALYVWLDAPGFSGRFSDNGFIMLAPDAVVRFHSWTKIGNLIDRFSSSLTVRSLTDVYTG